MDGQVFLFCRIEHVNECTYVNMGGYRDKDHTGLL